MARKATSWPRDWSVASGGDVLSSVAPGDVRDGVPRPVMVRQAIPPGGLCTLGPAALAREVQCVWPRQAAARGLCSPSDLPPTARPWRRRGKGTVPIEGRVEGPGDVEDLRGLWGRSRAEPRPLTARSKRTESGGRDAQVGDCLHGGPDEAVDILLALCTGGRHGSLQQRGLLATFPWKVPSKAFGNLVFCSKSVSASVWQKVCSEKFSKSVTCTASFTTSLASEVFCNSVWVDADTSRCDCRGKSENRGLDRSQARSAVVSPSPTSASTSFAVCRKSDSSFFCRRELPGFGFLSAVGARACLDLVALVCSMLRGAQRIRDRIQNKLTRESAHVGASAEQTV